MSSPDGDSSNPASFLQASHQWKNIMVLSYGSDVTNILERIQEIALVKSKKGSKNRMRVKVVTE